MVWQRLGKAWKRVRGRKAGRAGRSDLLGDEGLPAPGAAVTVPQSSLEARLEPLKPAEGSSARLDSEVPVVSSGWRKRVSLEIRKHPQFPESKLLVKIRASLDPNKDAEKLVCPLFTGNELEVDFEPNDVFATSAKNLLEVYTKQMSDSEI